MCSGRMSECLNAAAKDKLPILFLVIDNGRAINTFSPDVAANNEISAFGAHYNVPGTSVRRLFVFLILCMTHGGALRTYSS